MDTQRVLLGSGLCGPLLRCLCSGLLLTTRAPPLLLLGLALSLGPRVRSSGLCSSLLSWRVVCHAVLGSDELVCHAGNGTRSSRKGKRKKAGSDCVCLPVFVKE
eukprot:3758404-Rhodomonas_salina.1